ncbi:MAG: hypothetical protein HY852_07015 [Bradyrhizobium sp.]|uniref:hypothetical protein n=1 Tax=Bradyrhizobium sp. TaxID=376 RepID=UPI0025C39894|nr:hypothetical protein [Bradyrhizobium sp.]MBI5261552.1 hypothetical protein [Bradyrhizobium sp.]
MGGWLRIADVAVMSATSGVASAQLAFSTKPVHIFLPFAAGGAVDWRVPWATMRSFGDGPACRRKLAGRMQSGKALWILN